MDEEIKKLIEKNLEVSEEILRISKKVKSYMMWNQIMNFLKLLVIVVPIVLGIIYLPPILKNLFSQYEEIMGISGTGITTPNLNELLNLKSGLNK